MRKLGSLSYAALLISTACGHANVASAPPREHREQNASQAEIAAAEHPCGEKDKLHVHNIHSDTHTQAFVPCAASGAHDYSGLVRIETVENGVHIRIEAKDDDVTLLGPEVKQRDAVIVYPKGKSSVGIEVPLKHTKHGYFGEKTVLWSELDKLSDEGTKIHIAIVDHDKKSGEASEEMHVQLAVSTGKSCERAQDENPQSINFTKKGSRPDLTKDQLGAPMRTDSFFSGCGLGDSSNADICVAVKDGKPIGVSVVVTPANNKTAACIDRSARRLSFPASEKLDVVHQKF